MLFRSTLRHVCALDGSDRRVTLDLSGDRPRLAPDVAPSRRGKRCGLFAGEGLYLKTVFMPPMPMAEAETTLLLTERRSIPFPPDRARLAVATGPITPDGAVHLVAVADAPFLDRHRRESGCGSVTCVPSALSALRRHGSRFTEGGIDLFVHVDERVTGVHIIGDEGVLFTRESGAERSSTPEEQVADTVRAFRSWRSNGRTPIRGWIVGKGATDQSLREEITAAIGVTLTPYDPLGDGIDGDGEGVSLAPLIGAALIGDNDIDLAPSLRDTFRRNAPRRRWPVAVATALLVSTSVGYAAWDRLATLEAKRASLAVEVERLTLAKNRFDKANARLSRARDLLREQSDSDKTDRLRWGLLYDALSRLVPSSVALTGVTIDRSDDAGGRLTLEGMARGDERRRNDALWRMVASLEEAILDGKAEVTLALDKPDALDSPVRFTIVGQLRTVEASYLALLIKERSCSPA